MTPIERAARALCRHDGHPENTRFEGRPMWESYREQAQAVVTALKLEWQPIATAPRDGLWFETYTPEVHPSSCVDIAAYDRELRDFVKAGCGYQYATHWRALLLPREVT